MEKNNAWKKSDLTPLYWLGAITTFAGVVWMFLPHAYHAKILGSEDLTEHYIHIFQGALFTIIGLVFLVWNDRKNKHC